MKTLFYTLNGFIIGGLIFSIVAVGNAQILEKKPIEKIEYLNTKEKILLYEGTEKELQAEELYQITKRLDVIIQLLKK